MLNSLRHWLIRILGAGQMPAVGASLAQPEHHSTATASHGGVADAVELSHEGHAVPYDENLLEQARTQWQFGDWKSLTQIGVDTLQHHPDRAKLALLAAAGWLQTGQNAEAKRYILLAQDWGVSQKLVSQILVAGVYNSIGRAAALGNQPHRALQYFEQAVTTGTLGGDAKLLAQARSNYQQLQLGCARTPDSGKVVGVAGPAQRASAERADYLNRNGETLYQSGHYKLAAEYFQRALDLQPRNAWICQNLAEATARLDFKKDEPWECDDLAQTMAETGKWDVTVRHYRQALKLDPAQVEAHRAAQTFKVEPVQANHVDNPIFIVGCGHSGTSLMLAMLGNHPRIHPIPKESALFLRTDAALQKTMREWDADCSTQHKVRWAEKTPPHVFQIHRFLAFRPKARFVLMLRDGRDVVCSLKPRVGYAAFEDRLDRWIYDNMAGLPYWQHPQVHVVKYEDLVADPEATLRTLCQFLGEDYSPALLEYHKTEHRWYSDQIVKPDAIKTHSDHMNNRNWQINQPIFDGRGRWHAEMSQAEKDRFKNSPAQPLLERFGYVENCNW